MKSFKLIIPILALALILGVTGTGCACGIAEMAIEGAGDRVEEDLEAAIVRVEEESEAEETVTEPESLTDPEPAPEPEPVTDPENEVNELDPVTDIEPEPGIDISGTWSGTVTVTEGEGWFDDSAVGEPKPQEFVFKEEPDGSYTVHILMFTAPVFYDPVTGTIEFTFIFVEDIKTEYTGVVAREDDLWTMQGNVNEQGPEGYYRKSTLYAEKQD